MYQEDAMLSRSFSDNECYYRQGSRRKEYCSLCPSEKSEGINYAILYTLNLCGADTILAVGGVQGVASMAF